MELTKEMEEKVQELINKGGIFCTIYLDMHGSSKEDLELLLVEALTRLGKDEGVLFYVGEIKEPLFNNDIYSTTAEIKLMVKNAFFLNRICSRYTPIALEIEQPKEITISATDLAFMLLDTGNMAYQYSQFIIQNAIDKDKLNKYLKELENRKLLGKKLLEEQSEKNESQRG